MIRPEIAEAYHRDFYNSGVWTRLKYLGAPIAKSPFDLWLYQDILWALKPRLVVELGAYRGGSALFFSNAQRAALEDGDAERRVVSPSDCHLLTVDVDTDRIDERVKRSPYISVMRASSASQEVGDAIAAARRTYGGDAPIFVILDSDHTKQHVLGELEMLRSSGALRRGDYVVVEDTNINGHPVLPGWGDGPWEALEAYERDHPNDYRHDRAREGTFGWTQAPNGFLIKN